MLGIPSKNQTPKNIEERESAGRESAGTPSCSFFSLTAFLVIFQSYLLLCSLDKSFAFEGSDAHRHTVQISSLLPSTTCRLSTQDFKNEGAYLKVVHKHGPCTRHKEDKAEKTPSHTQILTQDQSRVNFIHSQLFKNETISTLSSSKSSSLPAKYGATVGTGNYIVTIGLGTPKKEFSLIFDTGSDLAWTQCEPCVGYCYKQKEPIFNPSLSTSYSNITCSSPLCSQLSGKGNTPVCSGSSCVYGIEYGDQSFSVGFFGKERLTLTSSDVFDNFLFGCGEKNQGLFGRAAGLLGLGRGKISIVKQTANKYGQVFSYCLPSTSSSTGYLAFGTGGGATVKYTPLLSNSRSSSLYGLDIVGISVGGRQLPISTSVFSTAGSIIDSGTVITRLPPAAYDALKLEFQKRMTSYPKADAVYILDTCYDLSRYETFSIPAISFSFGGGVKVDIPATGILYVVTPSRACLAFAGNDKASSVAIFGNVQQKTLKVVYDVGGGRLGFAPGGCN